MEESDMSTASAINRILASRQALRPQDDWPRTDRNQAAEGGCGVIGMACSEKIAGRHLLQALDQMRNRGNGKGGGIAAVGLVAEEFGVSQEVLDNDYLLAVAYLQDDCREEVEQKHIYPTFEVDHVRLAPHMEDYHEIDGLDVRPPKVVQYFVRIKAEVYDRFQEVHQLPLSRRQIEDEIVYQNTFRLNQAFYSSMGTTRSFVLSHGKNLLVMKMVGYGDDVVRYYQLEEMHAHVWIGHHRYPTKGRVWHPGGAHPFVGLNEALVHNGDFANYASIGEYLAQRNIYPLFLTDTEVSVQVFDLLYRTYDYPLEYVIEALAPTTERDFAMLPAEKQQIYHMLQVTHIHSSPDGPWFFLIAQSDRERLSDPVSDSDDGKTVFRLTCITDTSMLRPQVFAWQQTGPDGPTIGLAASEKQGIDAALSSLAAEDNRFWSRADRYWNARGGSHTDGGAFIFSAYPRADGSARLVCTNKFGQPLALDLSQLPYRPVAVHEAGNSQPAGGKASWPAGLPAADLGAWVERWLPQWDYQDVIAFLRELEAAAEDDDGRRLYLETLTSLMDYRYPTGRLRRSSLLSLYDQSLDRLVQAIVWAPSRDFVFAAVDRPYQAQAQECQTIVLDAGRSGGYQPDGPESLAMAIVDLYRRGFRKFIVANARGHRFIGNGLGPDSAGVRLDIYGSGGDYLASGIDGAELYVHGNAQDQLSQIMKSGKLVVYGDVGQTFMYGAKGGEAYVLGNAAGRPLINAVGKPRVVINGTCLDYLAESFMAGDPENGGGFVILNGIALADDGRIEELATPYPGGNLFSLASGGAIFVRDPYGRVTEDQLNGGEFQPFTMIDWRLIEPYLAENERLFRIPVLALLSVDGQSRPPEQVYRKIRPASVRALQAEEAWVMKDQH
jgi:glutamate synthase domain-containing protein 1/glutamate synthase domain-containing protein 3